MRAAAVVLLVAALCLSGVADASSSRSGSDGSPALASGVWPLPRSFQHDDHGPLPLPAGWGSVARTEVTFVDGSSESKLFAAALERFEQRVRYLGGADDTGADNAKFIKVKVTSSAEHPEGIQLSKPSAADYTIDTTGAQVSISAETVYGAMHALESLLQLVERATGGDFPLVLPSGKIALSDGPDYAWRGIMIDAGRRFFPVPLMKNIIDSMVAIKMNVVHLHASVGAGCSEARGADP